MKYIYVLDRLINKPIRLTVQNEKDSNLSFTYWEKILYKNSENEDYFVWTYLWYPCDSLKNWIYIWRLNDKQNQQFQQQQQKAKDVFELFKREFKSTFPDSIPVTARIDFSGNVAYFYFYAENRFDFVWFLKEFRKKLGYNFFLFQIWARDRIRMSPGADDIYWTCWYKICCKSGKCPLPTVDADNITTQNLENRWIEKMKWRCWKLKCCLNYEKKIYSSEWSEYPKKWDEFKINGKSMRCCWFNIMNWEIIVKNSDDEISKIDIKEYKKNNQKNFNNIKNDVKNWN